MITAGKLSRTGPLYNQFGGLNRILCVSPVGGDNNVVDSATEVVSVGVKALLPTSIDAQGRCWIPGPVSLLVVLGGADTATIQITGANQFGEAVSEVVSIAAGTLGRTLNAFSYVTRVEVLTATAGVASLQVCTRTNQAAPNDPAIGLPFKLASAELFLGYIGLDQAGTTPFYAATYNATYHTVKLETPGAITTPLPFWAIVRDTAGRLL